MPLVRQPDVIIAPCYGRDSEVVSCWQGRPKQHCGMPLSLSLVREHRSRHNRGAKHPSSLAKGSVCLCVASAHVWIPILFCSATLLFLLMHGSKWDTGDKLWSLIYKLVYEVKAQSTGHFWAYFLNASSWVCKTTLKQSLEYVHISVCQKAGKNHCLCCLRNIPLFILSTEESVAPGSYRQIHCCLLIYEFVQCDNSNMSVQVVGLWCVCLSIFLMVLTVFVKIIFAKAAKYNRTFNKTGPQKFQSSIWRHNLL